MHPKVAEANHYLSLVSPVRLDRGDQVMGTVFRKQILSYGKWINPNYWWEDELWMTLDEEIADQMIANFNAKTFGKHISVPLNHTGDVNANAGEVIKLEKGEGGLYAYLDIRNPKVVEDIENGLIFDVSMGFDFDYVDQKNGDSHGATLIHVALVTDPYLNDMADFEKTDKVSLSKGFKEFANSFGFPKEANSIILMSKSNVEELKRMKLSKITNDKDYPVEVTYKDAEGEEVTATIEAGAEIEVPETVKNEVTKQVTDSVKPDEEVTPEPDAPEETPEEKTAREAQEAADADKTAEGEETVTESEKEELARLRAENIELTVNEEYKVLLAKGKIVPAQKDLFLAAARQGEVTLTAPVKGLKLEKGKKTSVVSLLSAILEAGPTGIKYGEQGSTTEGEVKAELSKEQEKELTRMGFDPKVVNKHLAAGTISLNDQED
jgi:hypothetical protein